MILNFLSGSPHHGPEVVTHSLPIAANRFLIGLDMPMHPRALGRCNLQYRSHTLDDVPDCASLQGPHGVRLASIRRSEKAADYYRHVIVHNN